MAVPWREAERIHWIIGKIQMAKRGSDDSFRTTRFNLTPSQVDDAKVQAQRQQRDQQQGQQRQVTKPEWSGDEETLLFAYKRCGMKDWEDISRLLPGRTADGCSNYHARQSKTGPAWPQERKNELCKLYESLKSSMWAKIGEELKMEWEHAEYMHWRLGAAGMAERAGVPLSTQADFRLAPLEDDIDNAEVDQHRDREHGESSRHHHPPLSQTEPALMAHEARLGSSVTLPSFAHFAAGVDLS
ncbi:hypothetical protein E4U16_000883 [Claviceps sp. LM84 group G4]|nr:hypothetical protein E4U16_000883 [Claviceps sp. LM84 group G4]KAG6082936.1 hypothetical protein E4U33_005217 [Claviceps sp. LM78 group G4]